MLDLPLSLLHSCECLRQTSSCPRKELSIPHRRSRTTPIAHALTRQYTSPTFQNRLQHHQMETALTPVCNPRQRWRERRTVVKQKNTKTLPKVSGTSYGSAALFLSMASCAFHTTYESAGNFELTNPRTVWPFHHRIEQQQESLCEWICLPDNCYSRTVIARRKRLPYPFSLLW